MADILIRGVPVEVLAAIDAKAKRVGLSRNEYLCRTLEGERVAVTGPVSVEDFNRFAVLAQDLRDPDVMAGAWS
ncbi:MAG: antitoxin [bacterium]|nr:antitoxin [bacterium]MXZ78640.1 antitoxin [Acidimicrobiia bacterium]MYJ63229.1 antitoxin [Acidimicrobiia bacterium]